MENRFVKISDVEVLPGLMETSNSDTVVIFKHSTTCPMSASAYSELSDVNHDIMLVEVQRARDLSKEIERRMGVKHESPQVIVLKKGQVVWNASHFQIKRERLNEAIMALKQEPE